MKPFLFVISLLICSGASLHAQDYTTVKNTSRKAIRCYQEAEEHIYYRRLDEASAALREAIAADSLFVDAWIQLGSVAYDRGAFEESRELFARVLRWSPDYYPRLWYQYGIVLMRVEAYEEAVTAFERFLASKDRSDIMNEKARHHIRNCRFAAEAIAHPVPFEPAPLPGAVNTAESEYLPAFSADGSLLIYTAVRNGQEDFFFSEQENGVWKSGKPLAGVNTSGNEGAQSISADGKIMVFTACNRPGGLGSCDLYIAYRTEEGWTKPENLGAPVNSAGWESQPALSASGQVLFFAGKRANGKGGSDIWITFRNQEGRWVQPQNLGSVVNTSEDDQSPFMHPDGKSLYFMSKGHPGMGEFDLYVTRLQDDGYWSEPQNLGYPINTSNNEGALVVSLDGQTAYFASDQGGDGQTDIFSFQLPAAVQPAPVTYVKARVIDAQDSTALDARVEMRTIPKDQVVYSDRTGAGGTFLVCLPAGKDYALSVEKEGYLFHSEHFSLKELRSIGDPYLLTIALQKVPAPDMLSEKQPLKPVVLRNVFFASGSAELLPESFPELNRLLALLREQPDIRIQINGHTDDVGSETDNLILSRQRAKAVRDYLLGEGVAAARITYEGFGESQPVAPNADEAGRKLNRRTEFLIIS